MKGEFKVVKNTLKKNEKGQFVGGALEMSDGMVLDLDHNRIILPDTSWGAKFLA